MKIERLSHDKIRIFLTFDDLTERGIEKEDMWREIPKVHELFSDMMDQAYSELGFDATGPLAVEVYQLPAQGMVVIVTKGKGQTGQSHEADEDADEVYEMEVTMEQSDLVTYAFQEFEHVLQAAKLLQGCPVQESALFSYKGKWIVQLEATELEEGRFQAMIAVLSEFGEASSVTRAVLEEYGKTIVERDVFDVLCAHFK